MKWDQVKKKDEDRLIEYYTGDAERPLDLLEKEKRYDFILMQMLNHRTDRYIVEMLIDKFKIKKTQAYQDIRNAQYIHGNAKKIERGFELYKQQQDIEKVIRMSLESGNELALLKALELRDKLIAKLPEDTDLPMDKMGNKNYYMIFQLGDKSIKLDLKKAHEVPREEMNSLIEELNTQTIDADYEVLSTELKKELRGE